MAIDHKLLGEDKMNDFYIVAFNFESSIIYALWYTRDVEGFLFDDTNQRIKIFTDLSSIYAYANLYQYAVHDEINEIVCDKDRLLKIDCNKILSFWNIVTDIARLFNIPFIGDDKSSEINCLYDKFFYGCNLPAFKGSGESFIPAWSLAEQELITRIIDNGIYILKSSLQ